MKQIIVTISGGNLIEVTTNVDEDIEVFVIDEDNEKVNDNSMRENNEYRKLQKRGDFKEVY